jgi:hypothetical protein
MTALPTIFRRLLSTVINSFTACSTEKRSASTLTTLTVPRLTKMQRHSSSLATDPSPVKFEPSRYLRRLDFAKSARRTNVRKIRKGLAQIKKNIYDLANITPEHCRTERARCIYLHKAVLSEDWATAEMSKARTSECTFEEMY